MSDKSSKKFCCNYCDYNTSRKSQYDRHILTLKHINQQKSTISNIKVPESSTSFMCSNCDKIFKDRSGLWRHSKKCKINLNYIDDTSVININDKNIMFQILKQNDEFKQLIIDQNKTILEQSNKIIKIYKNSTSNTNINSHNKTFNLQFFLNETCKDAMNIMDFIDSIKLQLTDLERVGNLGYVEGISNIIVKNLKELDVTQRPVHCTDKKRETLYIKDENKWEKDETKQKMHKLVKRVASKNARLLPKFKEAHPDCCKSVSKFSDQYNKIIVESMGGSGDNDYEKEEKIINKISKEILVEK